MKKNIFFVFIFCGFFFPILAQNNRKVIRIETDQGSKTQERWESAENFLNRLEYSLAFKILQTFLDIPIIFQNSNSSAEETPGKFLVLSQENAEEFHYISYRQKALKRMAQMPPEVIEVYQTMFDSAAEPWFQSGKEGDPYGFLMVIARYPFSSYGDDAYYLLSSWEMERGNFERALILLEQFLTLFRPENTSLSYADILAQSAWVQRKLGLLSFSLETQATLPTLNNYLGEWKSVVGSPHWKPYYEQNIQFQGQTMRFVDFLERLWEVPVAVFPKHQGEWPTLFGNNAHNRMAPPLRGIGKMAWKYQERPSQTQNENEVFSFPVISNGRIFARLDKEIVCLDAQTGEVKWKHFDANLKTTKEMDLYGGTLSNGVYYTLINRKPNLGEEEDTIFYLYAFDAESGKLLWRKSKNKDSNFDVEIRLNEIQLYGTPLVIGPYVICAGVKRDQAISSYLHWFNRHTGELLLQQLVCAQIRSETEREGLTVEDPYVGGLAEFGGVLFFSTGIGANAAFDAYTGETLWLNQYKLGLSPQRHTHLFFTQSRAKGTQVLWWFNPPVVHYPFVYFTPTDTSSLFQYHFQEGRILKLYPELKNTKFQYLSGVFPNQTLLLTGPYLFRLAKLDAETQTLGEHPMLEAQILGAGLATPSEIFLPCARIKNLIVEEYFFRKLDLKQGAKLVEETPWKGTNSLNLEKPSTFTVVELNNRKYIFCVNGNRLVAFFEKD